MQRNELPGRIGRPSLKALRKGAGIASNAFHSLFGLKRHMAFPISTQITSMGPVWVPPVTLPCSIVPQHRARITMHLRYAGGRGRAWPSLACSLCSWKLYSCVVIPKKDSSLWLCRVSSANMQSATPFKRLQADIECQPNSITVRGKAAVLQLQDTHWSALCGAPIRHARRFNFYQSALSLTSMITFMHAQDKLPHLHREAL